MSATLERLSQRMAILEDPLHGVNMDHVGVCDFDIKSGTLSSDKVMRGLLGVCNSPNKLFEHVDPTYALTVKKSFQESLETGKPFNQTFTLKDGRCIHSKGKTLYDIKGNPTKLVLMGVEVTGEDEI